MEKEVRIINGFEVWQEDPAVVATLKGPGRIAVWPFSSMRVGETMVIADKDRWQSAYMAARYLHQKTNMRFHLNKWPEQRVLVDDRGRTHKTPYTGLKVTRIE